MSMPSKDDLIAAIETAAYQAITSLFTTYNENFYYCALFTTEEGLPPVLAAWSWEALKREVSKDPENNEMWLKWSWADSPYLDYGSDYFSEVKRLFFQRPTLLQLGSPEERRKELKLRLAAMEQAMKNLDQRGLFGQGEARKKILINAEVIPPDYINTETARRLNPPEALGDWLKENAEPAP